MVQVDVFWSYGIGAGFAYAAKKQLQKYEPKKEEGGWFANPYFSKNLLYLATLFGPSGLYLVWHFTSWETMHAGTKDMPGWLVTLFAITNVTQGMLGFWMTHRLLRQGKDYLAFLQPLLGYFGMFMILVHGWDGTGFKRFFSEDTTALASWTPAHIPTWLLSDVALTLGAMGCILIPVMLQMMLTWGRQGYAMAGIPRAAQYHALVYLTLVLTLIFGAVLGTAIVGSVLMHTLGTLPGLAAFAVFVAFAVVGKRGLLRFYFNQLDMDQRAAAYGARQALDASAAAGLSTQSSAVRT
jgi:hypothetical protein